MVRVAAESHSRPERAGFSVIATAADLSAIELAFWTDEIWAQSGPDFLHAEGAPFDTTAGRIRYDLVIHDGRYRLSAGERRVAGPLRRYDSFGTPYQIPGFPVPRRRHHLGGGPDRTRPRRRLRAAAGSGRRGGRAGAAECGGGERTDGGVRRLADLATWTEVGTAVSAEGTARLEVAPDAPLRFFRSALR